MNAQQLKTANKQQLIENRINMPQFIVENNIPVVYKTQSEAKELYQGTQMYGGLDYENHTKDTFEQLKAKVLKPSTFNDQAIHFVRNGQLPQQFVVYGYRGGYGGFFTFSN